ncbi:3-dehydro-L-gulonate 2-dehydrogenase [Mucilaginibacter sp.]|uniref:3-dehydro-L-gulonate 2-dehydrogenase n=1 Tax=Mucilaginibacter sp. TaxID=1882438 RepID=UPI003AFF65EB
MMQISHQQLKSTFENVLLKTNFSAVKAALCSKIFADNSLDGVYSHGLNRFPVFIEHIKSGLIIPEAEPELLSENGSLCHYDGHFAPGMYNATIAMQKAIDMAKINGIACISIKNTNHWMRGGTYGWQAANAGCIGICFTNTIANMPPWGGKEPRLGNNPLVIAVPKAGGHLVLDMAMSQYSYGKLQEHELNHEQLPFAGGYDTIGNLTTDPQKIKQTQRALPIGLWKGSGLSFMLDVLLTALSGGKSTSEITTSGKESGVSQTFIAIYQPDLHQSLIEQIIDFTKSSATDGNDGKIRYPGEKTLITRNKNLMEGIPVDPKIWEQVCRL